MYRTEILETDGVLSIDSLREHVQWAIELEHATIPSYLTALYSLDPVRNADAADVLHSVLLEEMLHLSLAANLLNAIGGRPVLDDARLLPGYPRSLPHSDRSLEVSLVPFGRDAVELFLRIEQPCAADAPPQDDDYATIGQFYEAIRRGLVGLCAVHGEAEVFSGDPARQVTDREFRGGPGRIFAVTGLETALRALDLIVDQGEGAEHVEVWDGDTDMFHSERDAVGHFYRFRELQLGRRYRRGDTPTSGPTGDAVAIDWEAVAPMHPNPRSADHEPGSAIRTSMDEFNRIYCTVLSLLEQTFDGKAGQLGAAIHTMFDLRAVCETLMTLPNDDGIGTAGPSFEYVVAADRRHRPVPGLDEMLVEVHAALESIDPAGQRSTEFAGKVAGFGGGDGEGRFVVGEEVYGFVPSDEVDATATFIVVRATAVAGRPRTVSFAESATLPIAAATAWHAVAELGDLRRRPTLLVSDADTPIGRYVVQIATLLGARLVREDAELVIRVGDLVVPASPEPALAAVAGLVDQGRLRPIDGRPVVTFR